MVFQNAKGARKIRIDDCVPIQGPACDYLVVASDGREHFVELKGKNVEHAIKQLESTIPQLSLHIQSKKEIWCFIVCSESPISTKTQKFKEQFKKKFKATLKVKTGECEHMIA
jgi:hypothetical protein